MKEIFPKYKAGDIAIIRNAMKPKDKKVLEDFLIYCGGTAGERKLVMIERIMLKIYDVMQISLDKITLEDLRRFLLALNKSELLEETRNDIKKTLKRFLKEFYKDWNVRFAGLKDIKTTNGMNHKKLNSRTILTPEELEKLIRGAESLKYKALIMLMFESAGRPEEILKLKWSDLDLNKGEVKLYSSKTGRTRVNPIKESILHLKRYKQEYSYPDVMAQDYVFPSHIDRTKQISNAAISAYFKALAKRTIEKPLFPYLLRHTRASQLQKELPPKIYEKFMDHSIEMASRYSHLTKDDVREVMLEKIYHIEELSEEDKEEVKALKKELSKIRSNNDNLQKKIDKLAADNDTSYKLLKRLNRIVQVLQKTVSSDKKIEAFFKKQLSGIFAEG